MLTVAHRLDRHFAFDGWMQELGYVPLEYVPVTVPAIVVQVGQIVPTGNARTIFASMFVKGQIWPTNVSVYP